MATQGVSRNNSQVNNYSRQQGIERNQQARAYQELSPDQKRADAQTRKPQPRTKILGSKIDIYA